MSLSNVSETALAEYIFEGTNPWWHTATDFDIHLHTGDPGEAGATTTNEATYTNYSVINLSRNGATWTVSGDTVTNASLLQAPPCTGGSNTLTHWSISTDGDTRIIVSGVITTPLNVSTGITPQFAAGDLGVVFD
jgi:hypothetical protein